MSRRKFLVVGAGFSGAVLARELVTRMDASVLVVDSRSHIAGNCFTERDAATGVMVHRYGPHIFNTSSERVWGYVNRFASFWPFVNRVKAVTNRGVFTLPINLHTINQFFGKSLNPRKAREFIAGLGDPSIGEPRNFEEQALKSLGRELYKTFFYGYTVKQWGCEPRELPAAVLKRLPIRFNYDSNYYEQKYQGIPEQGYTEIVRAILEHPAIEVRLNHRYFPGPEDAAYDHVFYTGPLDAYFGYSEGRLGYRTVTFERIDAEDDFQGNAVLNYPDLSVPWTRIHEHKHFTPWEKHERTVAFREFSKETAEADEPYYPKRLARDKALLGRYREMAESLSHITFLGRLATYRYMDMETVIGEALLLGDRVAECYTTGNPLPKFPDTGH